MPFFQRAGKMQGVVEYVLGGHRLKVAGLGSNNNGRKKPSCASLHICNFDFLPEKAAVVLQRPEHSHPCPWLLTCCT
jgi:hypothetical protein